MLNCIAILPCQKHIFKNYSIRRNAYAKTFLQKQLSTNFLILIELCLFLNTFPVHVNKSRWYCCK